MNSPALPDKSIKIMMEDVNQMKKDLLEYLDIRVDMIRLHTSEELSRLFSRKLTEAKLDLSFHSISRLFSFSNLYHNIARKVILPGISHFLGILIDRMEKKTGSGERAEAGNPSV